MNNFQIKTAENAKKKLQELKRLQELEPILLAACEGKVIRMTDSDRDYYSDKARHEFTYPSNRYSVVKDKQKVYTLTYLHSVFGLYTLGSSDKKQYDEYVANISGYEHCKILKETVEEFEV